MLPTVFALLGHTPCQPAVRATKRSQMQPGACRTRTTVCSTCAKCMFSSTAKRWQWSTWRATRLSTGISVPHSGVTVWLSACCLLRVRSACDSSGKLSTSDSKRFGGATMIAPHTIDCWHARRGGACSIVCLSVILFERIDA